MRTGLKNQREWMEGTRRPPIADSADAGGQSQLGSCSSFELDRRPACRLGRGSEDSESSFDEASISDTDAATGGTPVQLDQPSQSIVFKTRAKVSRLKSCRAFTLIELMAVVLVICVLIGTLIGVAKYANRQIGVTRAKTQMAALQMALEAYKTDVGYYPVSTWVRCSGNFYAEQSNAACLYRALTRPKCYYRARQTDIGAANGVTFFKDPWGTQWNYYRPALPQPTSLVVCNVTGGGFGYAWGGQHNSLTYDLYSYGPDKITSIPGANNGWICADETGAGRDTDDIINWKR